ncbi:MAG: hypothetical protein SNJ71_06660 [Bacteroidales bacterium]
MAMVKTKNIKILITGNETEKRCNVQFYVQLFELGFVSLKKASDSLCVSKQDFMDLIVKFRKKNNEDAKEN